MVSFIEPLYAVTPPGAVSNRPRLNVSFIGYAIVNCTKREAVVLKAQDFADFLGALQLDGKVSRAELNDMRKMSKLLTDQLRQSYPDVDWKRIVLRSYSVVALP